MTRSTVTPLPSESPWLEVLRDGTHVLIRSICPQDRENERAFIEGLSSHARHYRFLGGTYHPSEAFLSRLTAIDPAREAAFIALDAGQANGSILGVSRFSADSTGERCECAVTVADHWQNKGLATALMRHLIDAARARGMRTMYSVDLAGNAAMNDLARHLGFSCRADPDDPSLVVHELELQPADPGGSVPA